MESPKIILVACPPLNGRWSSETQLQIGRVPEMNLTLDDSSISRRHAEVLLVDDGWVVRDNGSTNGTHLNGVRVGRTAQRIRSEDIIRVGKVDLRVELARTRPSIVRINANHSVQIEAQSHRTWAEAVEGFELTDERWQVDGKKFLSLMRAGYRLAHSKSPDEQFHRVLAEAVEFFGAARGAIFLIDEATGKLEPRCQAAAGRKPFSRVISRTPAMRAFTAKQSLLFKDCHESPEFQMVESVAHSSMKSIVCAVLRSPDRAFGVLHLDRNLMQEAFSEAELHLAESLAAALALGVERIQMVDRQQEQFLHTVTALAQAVEMRDFYTGNHTHRVTAYACELAEELGIPADERRVLRAAAALHDIGKIAIDDEILRKPGRLSGEEFDQMKTHVIRGSEIIQMVPGLSWALPVVRGHHERWDGTGYPDRLKGEAIPLLARVVGVADAFDAMTSDRPYRPGMSIDEAYSQLESGSGKQFDPRCVGAFIRIRPKIEAMLRREFEFRELSSSGTDTISARELQRQVMIVTPGPVLMTPGPVPAEREDNGVYEAATAALSVDV